MSAENLLAEVINLTESMYVAAMSSEWDALIILQDQQAQMIQQEAFKVAAAADRDALKRVSELTHWVAEMAEAHRAELYDEIKQLKKTDSVQNAYLQNTGDQADLYGF